tara:strand:+ start:155 stop:523 length:369 start_codon:yes stop_codon:yes gene_type:complete
MAFKPTKSLLDDLEQIEIDAIGQSVYDDMPKPSKDKIRKKAKNTVLALQAFLERQELNITDLEAEGLILPGEISTVGSPAAQANANPIKIKIQVSETSNKVGLPSVFQNVKKTVVKFLKVKD